jgi:hypothetical protein
MKEMEDRLMDEEDAAAELEGQLNNSVLFRLKLYIQIVLLFHQINVLSLQFLLNRTQKENGG